ncbi:MAG: exodeoxyribonuclease V subunit gamma [Anaerolineae bacterium]|jgi:ATP-dependent helicase/DNAse subunit B
MTIQLLLAPAAAGKTACVLERVREAAGGLQARPWVVVPTSLQVRAWRRRLAEAGGAMGVRVLTFDRLYAECLNASGEAYTELSEPVQYRLIRSVVDGLTLLHYAPLVTRPGFIQVLERLMGELKAARVHPDDFSQAVEDLGGEPRLGELAQVYATYQERLQAQGWADRAGLGWLAVEALEERAPDVARGWPLLVVDGFDSFTSVQLALLRVLAGRAGETIVTLTGATDGSERPLVHRRFDETRHKVEAALGVQAMAIRPQIVGPAPALTHLEASLYRTPAVQVEAGQAIHLLEAPDRATEVRAALRWLKARLVEDGLRADDVALLARNIGPYRPFILQIAAEFGLPVRLVSGFALRSNPAIAALLDLLRVMLPKNAEEAEPALTRRMVVEAWRSPYFDWSALPVAGAPEPIGITLVDADTLDAVARWGRVIGGLSQWVEALGNLAAQADPAAGGEGAEEPDEEQEWPKKVPRGLAAQALQGKFQRFIHRLTPPTAEHPYRVFVRWLEELIGPDPALQDPRFPADEAQTALRIVARARSGPPLTAERDVSALQALKDVLRGLVWAEEALGTGETVAFPAFFEELAGAVDAASYQLPVAPGRAEIVIGDVVQARGVPFRAVAVLGLAEGEFPAVIGEDPFLRDVDRERLREGYDLPLEPSTQSAEAEFFYEAVTRCSERLLLTRPRLADNGALWQASPFWEEVRRLVRAEPVLLTSESTPLPGQIASWPELMESLASRQGYSTVRDWVQRADPPRYAALDLAVQVHQLRSSAVASAYDGDLTGLGDEFGQRFGAGHVWSASRLETYRTCPFFFCVRRVLDLEPREEPAEGLDARQLGTLYHRILEAVYQAPGVSDPTDLEQVLGALPRVAGAILDAAPEDLGFRETAWWLQTRIEIVESVQRSLEALAALSAEFAPYQHEAAFGLDEMPVLVVGAGQDSFQLRGYIDRVDRAPGGAVRVIDYKTAGPWSYTKRAVAEGKKLQLPLYALAVRDALELGDPVEGFYWHVRQAEPSPFQMSTFDGGPEGAMEAAVGKAWEAVRGVRDGYFAPEPPDDGCPAYCPAGGFCWRYRARYGG